MLLLRKLLATVLALIPATAFADSFSVFQVQGSFQSGASLSGTLTLDTTTGSFTADTLQESFTGGSPAIIFFPPTSTQGLLADGRYSLTLYNVDARYDPGRAYASLYLRLPKLPAAGQTLQICTISTPCIASADPYFFESYNHYGYNQYFTEDGLSTGQISPLAVSTATPEPSSFVLLGTGLIAVGAAFRRRLICSRG